MTKRERTLKNPLGAGRHAKAEPTVPFNARLPISVANKLSLLAKNKTAWICDAINEAYTETRGIKND